MRYVTTKKFQIYINSMLDIHPTMNQDEVDRCVRSNLGVSVDAISMIWMMCSFPAGMKSDHMLWALMLLKTYDSEANLAKRFDVSRPTFRKYIWRCINEISNLSNTVVSFCVCDLAYDFDCCLT